MSEPFTPPTPPVHPVLRAVAPVAAPMVEDPAPVRTPGTVDDRTARVLDVLAGAGWANRDSGDVESPTGAFALIVNGPRDLVELVDVLDACDVDPSEYSPDALVGAFVAWCDSLGFKYATRFALDADTPPGFPRSSAAERAFDQLDAEYSAWNVDPSDVEDVEDVDLSDVDLSAVDWQAWQDTLDRATAALDHPADAAAPDVYVVEADPFGAHPYPRARVACGRCGHVGPWRVSGAGCDRPHVLDDHRAHVLAHLAAEGYERHGVAVPGAPVGIAEAVWTRTVDTLADAIREQHGRPW